MELKVKLGKLNLDAPIVCASGTFGYGVELKPLVNFEGIGAVATKTITFSPRAGNPPPRIYETEVGILNSIGLENPGVEKFVEEKLPEAKNIPAKYIVSVGGFSYSEYEDIVRRLRDEPGIDAFEINLSCPNLRLKKMVSQSASATFKLTKELRKLTGRPLFVKITPEAADIVKVAQAVCDAGADAVSMVNTFLSMAVNIESQKPYLGSIYGGYSGRAIKPLSLYRVWEVARKVKIPVIGGGGVENASDAIEFILAGAAAVSLGTINIVYPNRAQQIFSGIKKYMKRKKISDIKKLRGNIYA